MVAPMPPEDLPPLAPFPELSSANRSAGDAPPGDPPLLSEAQRREFAQAAGSLEGNSLPAPTDGGAPEADDDFLITSPADQSAPSAKAGSSALDTFARALPEEPVLGGDFLALSGSGAGAGFADDGFSLQSLAAALTGPPAPAPAAGPPPAPGDWDLPPFFSAPDPIPAPKPEPAAATVAQQPPIAIATPAAVAMGVPDSAAPAPITPKPLERPSPAAAAFSPVPLPASPGPQFSPQAAEREPDFDEPLTFPVPSASGFSAAPVDEIAEPNDRGIGMVLSGALLIVSGMILACRVPALALEADALAISSNALADVRVAHLQSEMFLCAAGAVACLLLGIGSATLRRWAPPLIHAAGWVVLLTVLVCMGTATASMFYLSSNQTPGDAVPGDGIALFAFAGLLGVALPLGLIALFQRPSVSRMCVLVDKSPRWTDRRTVPGLMVFITGVMLAVTAFALSIAHAALPLFGEIGDGGAASQVWAGMGLITAGAAGFAAAGKRAGWWLLFVLSVAMAVSLFLTCQQHDWRHLFHLTTTARGSVVGGILAAAAILPPILILLMTRRAFLHHGDTR